MRSLPRPFAAAQLDIIAGTALIGASPTMNYKTSYHALFEASMRTEPSTLPIVRPFCMWPFCWGFNFFDIASFEVREPAPVTRPAAATTSGHLHLRSPGGGCSSAHLRPAPLQAGLRPYVDGVVHAEAFMKLEYLYETIYSAGFSVEAGVRNGDPFVKFYPIWKESQRQEVRLA